MTGGRSAGRRRSTRSWPRRGGWRGRTAWPDSRCGSWQPRSACVRAHGGRAGRLRRRDRPPPDPAVAPLAERRRRATRHRRRARAQHVRRRAVPRRDLASRRGRRAGGGPCLATATPGAAVADPPGVAARRLGRVQPRRRCGRPPPARNPPRARRPRWGPLAWDLGFLAVSAVLLAVGLVLARSGPLDPGPRSAVEPVV